MSQRRVKGLYLSAALGLVCLASACASSLWGSRPAPLMTFNEAALKQGRGVILMHVIDQGSLIATRWQKLDDPKKRQSFTVYRSGRHRAFDRMDIYDVVTVEPGTYALYSVFGNCDEGLRPASTDWDEPWRADLASPLGLVSRLKSYKPGSVGSTGGVGIWGGSGGGGLGLGLSLGLNSAPGEPVAVCNLLTPGVKNGQAMLATVTVKAGEVVYAGELEFAYGADSNCDSSGNWLTDNETRQYCGADWARLAVTDLFSAKARTFIQRNLGAEAERRAVVRLAQPGSFVTSK
ncbi:MAG: hypothetical protein LBV21_03360 [Candidatus Adiutrix sp.]|jgi:hypothetical protein|nr:hypothetical protein [Candidatus Adiutrix sp.]